MLTSIGRAAARRVVSVNRTLTTGTSATARPLAVRSFTTSRWSFLAAKATADKPKAKKAAPKKQPGEVGENRGRPRKGAPPRGKTPKAAKAVKKKPAKKAVKAKKPAKKAVVLTPEQKERRKVKELRATALLKEEPTIKKLSAYNMYIAKASTGRKGHNVGEVSGGWKDLSAAEIEDLKREVAVAHEESVKAHAQWQATVPVEDIYLANLARNALRRMKKKTAANLKDERLPKKPDSPLNVFIRREVSATNKLTDAIAQYRTLSQSEREALAPNFRQDLAEFVKAGEVIRQMADLKAQQTRTAAKAAQAAKEAENKAKRQAWNRAGREKRKAEKASASE